MNDHPAFNVELSPVRYNMQGKVGLPFVFLSLFVLCMPARAASPVEAGSAAPSFELPRMDGEGIVDSDDLFSGHTYTFLVFWESGCSHCAEALIRCESFYKAYGGDDIAVVGINSNEEDILVSRGILTGNGITFLQLWDDSGWAADRYEVPFATFTIYLVDGAGTVLTRSFDPVGDMETVMEDMLTGGYEVREQVPGSSAAEGKRKESSGGLFGEGFMINGDVRIRYLGIDVNGEDAVGPYGEELRRGNHLLYRFDLELVKPLSRYATVGGLLRIGNEGEGILEAGPEYLGREWGSAYAEIEVNLLSFRLGYYPIHMTPLTLMRWDWDDNPRIGGDASCGCAAAAGVLLFESLEELGPELVFEGGLAEITGASYQLRFLYAIPRRAKEISRGEWMIDPNREKAQYSLELYGAEARWQRFDKRTGLFWKAGIHLLGTWENEKTVDFLDLGYFAPEPWYDSRILNASLQIPILSSFYVRGEWILCNRAHEYISENGEEKENHEWKGGGGIAGLVFDRPGRFELKLDYVRLEPDFYSPFAAISYEPNREGPRLSAKIVSPKSYSAVSIFYKRQREVEPGVPEGEKEQMSFFGASYDLDMPSGWGGSVGWLDRGNWRPGTVLPHDDYRRALVAIGRYRFTKSAYIEIDYQYIETRVKNEFMDEMSFSNIFGLYFSARY